MVVIEPQTQNVLLPSESDTTILLYVRDTINTNWFELEGGKVGEQ